MNPKIIKWISFALSIVALLGFISIYFTLLTTEWSKETQPNPKFQFLAATLAGLVGGIVAAAFGQTLPDPSESRSKLENKLSAFGAFLAPLDGFKPRVILAILYAIFYFIMSIWAMAVWYKDLPNTPKLTDDLAVISIGLIVAIIMAYMNGKGQSFSTQQND